MPLKPQDVLLLVKLVATRAAIGALRPRGKSYGSLAVELGMSPSEVHAAAERAMAAQLLVEQDRLLFPQIRNLEEFLVHGVRYCFAPERGGLTRGIPTAHAGPPLAQEITDAGDLPPVWPDPEGQVQGLAFSPLYKAAPGAARRDPQLYELLALLDAIRGGRAREREAAVKHLKRRLAAYG